MDVFHKVHLKSPWQDLTEGLAMPVPATSKEFLTGKWTTIKPQLDTEKCTQCLLCVPVCPDSSIPVKDCKRLDFDLDHCKGCGICAKACPVNAITMKEEI
jgi:pyruvate ferredoxin oxidoreductase delta subunit